MGHIMQRYKTYFKSGGGEDGVTSRVCGGDGDVKATAVLACSTFDISVLMNTEIIHSFFSLNLPLILTLKLIQPVLMKNHK